MSKFQSLKNSIKKGGLLSENFKPKMSFYKSKIENFSQLSKSKHNNSEKEMYKTKISHKLAKKVILRVTYK